MGTNLIDQVSRYAGDEAHGILDGGEPAQPTEADFQRETVAEGREAVSPAGVLYQAHWKKLNDGMARHAREQARALAASGLAVRLTGLGNDFRLDYDTDESVIERVGYLVNTTLSEAPVAIRQIVLHNPTYVVNVVCPAGARMSGFAAERSVYKSTIVYTSWERSTISPELVSVLNRCGQVWVPCKRNKQVFEAHGVKRVRVVPCPYEPSRHGPSLIPEPRGNGEVPYGKRFYAIGKWEPRKAYHELIGAFLLAFGPKDHASLYLKTHGFGRWKKYPANHLDERGRLKSESLGQWLEDSRVRSKWTAEQIQQRVRLDTRMLSEADLTRLHAMNNIYVSSSHGEAWDLPAFDAVAAGNALVHVGYGGSEDYAPPRAIDVPWRHGSVGHEEYGWEPHAEWADWEIDDMVEALRQAKPPTRRVAPPHLYAKCGFVEVGRLMRSFVLDLIGEVAKDREPGLWDSMRGFG